jgi:hypothetical protein
VFQLQHSIFGLYMMIQIDRVLGLNPNLSCLRIGVRGNLQPCNQSIEALVGFPSVFNDNPIAISQYMCIVISHMIVTSHVLIPHLPHLSMFIPSFHAASPWPT